MRKNSPKTNLFELYGTTKSEDLILENLHSDLYDFVEMNSYEVAFLNSMVLRNAPKKILEVGVSCGGSSAILLNAIKNDTNAHLYSIDYNTEHYKRKGYLTGFYVDNYPELKDKWTLHTGGLAIEFMDLIGDGIDMCFIDTVHVNPGEILDFLFVLPFLKKNALVIFHDTNMQVYSKINPNAGEWVQWSFTTNLLMSTVAGKKIVPSAYLKEKVPFSNIGAIILADNIFDSVWNIFNLLSCRWGYMIKDTEVSNIYKFIHQYYGEFYATYFLNTYKLAIGAYRGCY